MSTGVRGGQSKETRRKQVGVVEGDPETLLEAWGWSGKRTVSEKKSDVPFG